MSNGNEKNVDIKGDGGKRAHLQWTEAMDEHLINAFYHQMVDGNKQDRTFTSSAYDNVVKELRQKLNNLSIDKEKIRNGWMKIIKPNFHEVFDLFNNSSGFAWSPISSRFEVEPEVWEALIEKKPTAKKWRNKSVKHYDILREIFGSDRATGEGVETAKEKTRRWARERSEVEALKISEIDHMVLENQVILGNSIYSPCHRFDEPSIDITETPNASPTNTSGFNCQTDSQTSAKAKGKKLKAVVDESYGKEIEKVHLAIKEMADAIRSGSDAFNRSRPHIYSEQEVFEELMNMGLEMDLRLDAYDFLMENPRRVRSFFGCLASERKTYLLHKMNNKGGNVQ